MLEDTVTAASSNEQLVRHGVQVMTPAAQAANGSGSFKFLGGGFSFDRPHVALGDNEQYMPSTIPQTFFF